MQVQHMSRKIREKAETFPYLAKRQVYTAGHQHTKFYNMKNRRSDKSIHLCLSPNMCDLSVYR